MLKCVDANILLEKYLDGELGRTEKTELFVHAKQCDDCDLALRLLINRRIKEMSPRIPEDLVNNATERARERRRVQAPKPEIAQRMATRRTARSSRRKKWTDIFTDRRFVTIAASVAGVVVVGLVLVFTGVFNGEVAKTPPAAAPEAETYALEGQIQDAATGEPTAETGETMQTAPQAPSEDHQVLPRNISMSQAQYDKVIAAADMLSEPKALRDGWFWLNGGEPLGEHYDEVYKILRDAGVMLDPLSSGDAILVEIL